MTKKAKPRKAERQSVSASLAGYPSLAGEGFSFSLKTLPAGITKRDIDTIPVVPWERTKRHEAILSLCRLALHEHGMKHCPEYRRWIGEMDNDKLSHRPEETI